MKTSDTGIALICAFEGLELAAYPDPGSGGEPWTIGYGHTRGVKPGDTCTQEQATEWLREDLRFAEAAVDHLVKVALDQHQFDALVSCYLNKGNAVRPVIDLLNAGKRMDAMAAFLQINRNAKGEFKPGLASRREREMRMFLYADYSDEPKGKPKLKLWRGQLVGQPVLIDFPPDT